MKLLLTTIAAVMVVGCGRAPQSINDAAVMGNIEAVKQKLDGGVDVNAKGYKERTPLHWAAMKGHKEIVELLIAKGAAVNAENDNGWTLYSRLLNNLPDLINRNIPAFKILSIALCVPFSLMYP